MNHDVIIITQANYSLRCAALTEVCVYVLVGASKYLLSIAVYSLAKPISVAKLIHGFSMEKQWWNELNWASLIKWISPSYYSTLVELASLLLMKLQHYIVRFSYTLNGIYPWFFHCSLWGNRPSVWSKWEFNWLVGWTNGGKFYLKKRNLLLISWWHN